MSSVFLVGFIEVESHNLAGCLCGFFLSIKLVTTPSKLKTSLVACEDSLNLVVKLPTCGQGFISSVCDKA